MTPAMIRHALLGLLFAGLSATAQAAELTARIHWLQRAELATPVSGVVKAVKVFPGERVRQGQVLMELDARGFKAQLAQARAQLKSLEEHRAEAQRELERTTELYDRTLISDHDLQLAKNAAVNAEAEYQAARAALVNAELELEYSRLRAPFDGVVLERHIEPGEIVVSRLQSTPLMVLAATAEMLARSLVEAEVLGQLKQGQKLSVKLAGNTYTGVVHRLGLEPVEDGRYPLDIRFAPDAGQTLVQGQVVRVLLP